MVLKKINLFILLSLISFLVSNFNIQESHAKTKKTSSKLKIIKKKTKTKKNYNFSRNSGYNNCTSLGTCRRTQNTNNFNDIGSQSNSEPASDLGEVQTTNEVNSCTTEGQYVEDFRTLNPADNSDCTSSNLFGILETHLKFYCYAKNCSNFTATGMFQEPRRFLGRLTYKCRVSGYCNGNVN